MMKRSLMVFLCLSLLLSSMASCAEQGKTEEDTVSSAEDTAASADQTDTAAETDETEKVYQAAVPEGTKYGGMTFTVATYPLTGGDIYWKDLDWSATEYTGEVLNDAVFSRTTKVEDLLDIDIVTAYTTALGDVQTLTNSVTSNDNAYQLYTLNEGSVLTAATTGLLQDINDFAKQGTLDMTAPWWDQNCFQDLSIAHKNYCMTGDIGTLYKKTIGILMFNKKILEQNQMENPYDLRDSGAWTVDKVVELGSKISNDLDGNGKMDSEDQYGLVCFRDMLPLAMIGCDVPFFTKDENDLPANTFYGERAVQVVEKLATLMYDQNLTYSWSKNGYQWGYKLFEGDKCLFYYGELHDVEDMRAMESPFGVMPMPKYDEAQEGYHHCINPNVAAAYVLPVTNVDYERSGYIIDALGAASKNELTPAYYDKTLQGKASRDEESSASLDIVIGSIRYDLGYLGNWGLSGMLYDMADACNTDLTSKYKRVGKMVTKMMERTVGNLEKLNEAE